MGTKNHRQILFYKMKNNLCPNHLASLVPNNIGDVSRYNLRNVQLSQTVHANSQLYFNSFLPPVVREWSALPEPTRELNSMECFTNQLISDIIPPQNYNLKTIVSHKSIIRKVENML